MRDRIPVMMLLNGIQIARMGKMVGAIFQVLKFRSHLAGKLSQVVGAPGEATGGSSWGGDGASGGGGGNWSGAIANDATPDDGSLGWGTAPKRSSSESQTGNGWSGRSRGGW
ncbi:hypothetical protein F2P56_009786 [Juglans regia]|uniref:Uncharacterized protein n=1 Tax=Juglans regia TaxID=51240 RepID=A0A833XXD1_JUGRE|nr:hypothetical protein F2P56_009786 [Juglans regia]